MEECDLILLLLKKISGLTIEEIQEAEFQIYKSILFISEEQITQSTLLKS